MPIELTLLNSMADKDFDRSLDVHKQWGLRWLDLKDAIYGNNIVDLDAATADRAQAAIERAGLEVYCLSSPLMLDEIEKGEAHFRAHHLDRIATMKHTVDVLKPKMFRLLGAEFRGRRPGETSIETLQREYPWVIPAYREAVDRVADLGVAVTIENEAHHCILTTPEDCHQFFDALDRKGVVGFTWDIQNQWTSGLFPALEHYRQLKPLLQYVHVKGGQFTDPASRQLKWRTGLDEASWPVEEIVQAVVDDGISPVICINPSHGEPKPGGRYDYAAGPKQDIDFLRHSFAGIN